MEEKMEEETKLAPTASIETVIIIRPLKVAAVTMGFFTLLLMILYIGATTWVSLDEIRFGLWEDCRPSYDEIHVNCDPIMAKTWLLACRGLCLLAAIMTVAANFTVVKGLQAGKFRTRYRCYYIGMLLYFLAVLFNVTALIIYPIKYSENEGQKPGSTWTFGWAYGVGWGATVLLIAAALLLCLDKDADEIVFREKSSSDAEDGIEEELLTESDTEKADTESDIAYADEVFK